MASKDSKHQTHSNTKAHPVSASAKSGGLSPLQMGLIVAALIVVVGVAYVFMSQTQDGKPTPTPSATVGPSGTPTIGSGNFTLPKSAELTGNASCSNGSKMHVLLFTDPYCPACVANDPKINSFYQKYQNQADIQYRLASTHSRSLSPTYGIDTVYRAFDYFVCAQKQGKIQEFKKCFYGNLTLQNGDYIPETKEQLQGCSKSFG